MQRELLENGFKAICNLESFDSKCKKIGIELDNSVEFDAVHSYLCNLIYILIGVDMTDEYAIDAAFNLIIDTTNDYNDGSIAFEAALERLIHLDFSYME